MCTKTLGMLPKGFCQGSVVARALHGPHDLAAAVDSLFTLGFFVELVVKIFYFKKEHKKMPSILDLVSVPNLPKAALLWARDFAIDARLDPEDLMCIIARCDGSNKKRKVTPSVDHT